jgi:FMN phosphatase YigB (HAD superfamily)
MSIKNIIFDFEGVFIKWKPFILFNKYVKSEAEMLKIFAEIDHDKISSDSDLGTATFSGALMEAAQRVPKYKEMIIDYDEHWSDIIKEIPDTLDLAKELKSKGYELFGLSNFPGDKIDFILDNFEFSKHLKHIVVSALVKMVKPNAEIYELLLKRADIKAQESLFFDDRKANIEGAKKVGIEGFVYTDAAQARKDLSSIGIKLG